MPEMRLAPFRVVQSILQAEPVKKTGVLHHLRGKGHTHTPSSFFPCSLEAALMQICPVPQRLLLDWLCPVTQFELQEPSMVISI